MGYKGPLQIVTPEEFRNRTSLTFSARSGSTLALDKAYDAYHAVRSPANADALYAALKAYRAAHGGFWNKCERNTVSGGLLEYLYEQVNPNKLSASQVAAKDRAAAHAVQNTLIPDARLGVLYFLANIKIEMDAFGTAVDGLASVGGSIGVGMTTDFSKTGSAALGTRAVFTAPLVGAAVKAEPLAIGGKVAAKGLKQAVDKALAPSLPQPSRLPTTADALTALANQLSGSYEAGRYKALAKTVLIAGPTVGVALAMDIDQHLSGLWGKIKAAFDKVGEMIRRAWYRKGDLENARVLGMLVKAAAKVAVDLVMKNAIPFLGGAIDLGTGLVRAIGDACTRVAAWSDRRRLDLQAGHPAQMADAIEAQMSKGVARGLAEALVGAAKAAVSLFLPGLGSLVSVVMGAIEWMVRTVSRLSEQSAIQNFLTKAREVYEREMRNVRKVDGVYAGTKDGRGLINSSRRFAEFFQLGCEASPLIPMLALNSGLSGSWMTMLQLFDEEDGQPRFKANASQQILTSQKYFSRLKQFSAEYIRLSGFKVMPMRQEDLLMTGYLKHALSHGQTGGNTALGSIEAALRA